MRFSASIVDPTPAKPELDDDEDDEEDDDEELELLELEDDEELLDELLEELLEELLFDGLGTFPPPQAINVPIAKHRAPAFSSTSPLFPELASVIHATLFLSKLTGQSRFLLSIKQQWGDKVARVIKKFLNTSRIFRTHRKKTFKNAGQAAFIGHSA